jgi:hypothetical protein
MNVNAPPIGYDSKSEISYPSMNSAFYIHTARGKSMGRGQTLYRVHGSEVAFWDMNSDDIDNLTVGVTEAARYGEIVYETTANGADGWFYHKYKEAMEGKNEWIPLFYPWYIDPMNYEEPSIAEHEMIIDTLDDEESELVDRHNLNIGQLYWRRNEKRRLKKLFAQEYPSNWTEAFLVRGSTFFNHDTVDKIARTCDDPIRDNDQITVWKDPEPGVRYVCGADCSEGLDAGDFSVCGILNLTTGEQVARLMGRWRPEVFARKSIELCKKYNNAVFACEINNHGHSVMNTVMNTLHYKYIYYRMNDLKRSKGRKVKEKKPGWQTNAQTRPILLDDLNEALEEQYMIVNDQQFLMQCKTFVDRGGKYEASAGEHDDLVIAWGIAWQARKVPKKGTIII